ncbi:MAG: hypothetical protein IPF57_24640 [Gammaproteobacteria bacterium]|nr:hypothetical protein [Gammaproteobacteria bacterium]
MNDIVPTILEVTGIAAPASVDGVAQRPMDGVSLAYSFDDAKAAERHATQYFEIFGNRSIYHEGWMASAFADARRGRWTAPRATRISTPTAGSSTTCARTSAVARTSRRASRPGCATATAVRAAGRCQRRAAAQP